METSRERLNPFYVTGIIEGEGSFCVSFTMRERSTLGIETRPSFSITLSKRDIGLLKEIRIFFGCGGIRYSRSDRTYKYEVRSVKDIRKKIIPHFRRFPLIGEKAKDFEIFERICIMVSANLHLNKEYLKEIVELACTMNPSGRRKYKREDLLRVLCEVKV